MDDFDTIVSRIKTAEGLSTNQQIAELFELSPQEFSRRKKRETLLPLIIEWGISRSADLTWLLTGESAALMESTGGDVGNGLEGPIEMDFLKDVIEVVERVLSKHGLMLEPPDKAEAITILYEMYQDTGKKPEERTAERILRLAA